MPKNDRHDRLVAAFRKPTAANLRLSFAEIDADDSGTISKRELYEVLREAGLVKGHGSINKKAVDIFQRADADSDGQLGFAEFKKIAKALHRDAEEERQGGVSARSARPKLHGAAQDKPSRAPPRSSPRVERLAAPRWKVVAEPLASAGREEARQEAATGWVGSRTPRQMQPRPPRPVERIPPPLSTKDSAKDSTKGSAKAPVPPSRAPPSADDATSTTDPSPPMASRGSGAPRGTTLRATHTPGVAAGTAKGWTLGGGFEARWKPPVMMGKMPPLDAMAAKDALSSAEEAAVHRAKALALALALRPGAVLPHAVYRAATAETFRRLTSSRPASRQVGGGAATARPVSHPGAAAAPAARLSLLDDSAAGAPDSTAGFQLPLAFPAQPWNVTGPRATSPRALGAATQGL